MERVKKGERRERSKRAEEKARGNWGRGGKESSLSLLSPSSPSLFLPLASLAPFSLCQKETRVRVLQLGSSNKVAGDTCHELIHLAKFWLSYIFLNAYISAVLGAIEVKFSRDIKE